MSVATSVGIKKVIKRVGAHSTTESKIQHLYKKLIQHGKLKIQEIYTKNGKLEYLKETIKGENEGIKKLIEHGNKSQRSKQGMMNHDCDNRGHLTLKRRK